MTLTLDCATMARSLIPCCLALWVLGATASHAADGPATGEHGKAGSCYAFLEAEELKAEQCEVRPHFPNWYFGAPSGGKMLRAMTQGAHAQAQFAAPADGPYVLWVRYLSWRPYRETISVAVSQGERQRADAALNAARIVPTEYKSDDFGFFVWERVAVELAAGPVTVALANPDKRGWHLDCLVLTNDADYMPDTRDFAPPLYLRFTVTAEEPRTFHIRTVWKQVPWRGFVGYIGSSGMSRGRPSKPEALLKPNEPSPWIKVNRWLHPLLDNTLHIEQHGPDRAEASDFRGIVEVAAGTEKQLLRRYEVKRDGCRFNLILPLDVGNPTRLKADYEFVEDTARYVKTLPAPQGQRPSQMLLATHLALQRGKESTSLIDAEMEALKRLGFNALWRADLTRLKKHGFSKAHAARFVWHVCKDWPPGCRFQPDFPRMVSYYEELRAQLGSDDLDPLTCVTVMDEPASGPFEHLAKCPVCHEEFVKYLRAQGANAAELGLRDLSEARVAAPEDAAKSPALYYHSQNFRHYATTEYFRTCRRAVEQVFPPHVTVGAALADAFVYHGNMLERINWFDIFRRDGLSLASCGSWINVAVTDQLMNYVLAVMRCATQQRQQPWLIHSIIQGQEPLNFKLKSFTILGYGAKFMNVFDYGPYYMKNGDYFSHRRDGAYEAVQDVNYTVGAADDLLSDVQPIRGSVAVLFSETTDVWMIPKSINNYGREREAVFLALRHAQYPVDIVTESDLASGALKDYRVLYLVGSHVLPQAAEAIRKWVEQGGVLWSDLGSGLKDHWDRNLNTLQPVYGIKDWSLGQVRTAAVGKTGMLTCTQPSASVDILPVGGLSASQMNAYFGRGDVVPVSEQVQVLARFPDGRPAALLNRLGKGASVHCAFWPGLTYFKKALPEKLAPGEERPFYASFIPTDYPADVRDLIALGAKMANAERPATADVALVEPMLQTGKRGAVLTLVNYSLQPLANLTIRVKLDRPVQSVASARHGPIRFAQAQGEVAFSLPLDVADFVSLYFAGQ